MNKPPLTHPTLHLNGTSADMLIEGYMNAATKVREAIDTVNAIEFHRRDYYVQDADGTVWHKAVEEHEQRRQQLASVQWDLEAIAQNVANQRDERERRSIFS